MVSYGVPSILLKNIPPRLHSLLKKRAASNRRSLNSEILRTLEETLPATHTAATATSIEHTLSEDHLAAYPHGIAAKLRAFRELGSDIAARNTNFYQWRKAAADSRR